MDELTRETHRLAEAMYRNVSGPPPKEGPSERPASKGNGGGSKGKGEVIDAEFEEK
jgi:hypothetical protein